MYRYQFSVSLLSTVSNVYCVESAGITYERVRRVIVCSNLPCSELIGSVTVNTYAAPNTRTCCVSYCRGAPS